MKNRSIVLKNKLTATYLRSYLYRIFNSLNKKAETKYLKVILELELKNNQIINLNDNQILDISNNEEVKSYVKMSGHKFISIKNKINLNSKDILCFYYSESNKEEYNKYIMNKNYSEEINDNNIKPNSLFKTSKLSNFSLGRRYYSTKIPKFMDDYNSRVITLRSSLTESNLRTYLYRFFRETKFNSRYIFVLTKVSYEHIINVRTLGYKTIIDLNRDIDIKNYVNSCIVYFNEHDDMSHPEINDNIIFSWLDTNETIYYRFLRNKYVNKYTITDIPNFYNIPYNTSYNSWGTLKILDINKSVISNITFNSDISFIDINKVDPVTTLINVVFKDNETFKFNDIDLRDEANNYKRVYLDNNNREVYFKDNIPFFYFDPKISPPKYQLDKDGNLTNKRMDIIKPLPVESKLDAKFMTFDLETYESNEKDKNKSYKKLNLLSASLFDGEKSHSVYRGDFNSDKDMLDSIFNIILTENYNGRFVYIHNGANFDLTFLVNYLLDKTDIKIDPLYKDGIFLSLTIKYGKKYKNSIEIRDSLLMLPSSLAKLGKSLKVNTQKDIYPYDFPNKNNLNYNGNVPSYNFFDPKKVIYQDYIYYFERFKDTSWNLKKETINYCENDCVSLYQIINKFSKIIFKKFNVSMFKSPTLASLTFRIYRTKYLGNKTIPMIDKNLYDVIVNSYFGGHVDCYIPESNPNYTVDKIQDLIKNKQTDGLKTVKHYDVNSLYPFVMKDNDLPTDILGYFKGDINLINGFDHFKFGIFKVNVNCLKEIKHPILPFKQNGRCIYPVGKWTGWYNTLEINNAKKYGYTFNILEGYLFDTADLFSEFVNDLYTLKQNSPKTEPMYLISKLLMNSLYGKFGINPHLLSYKFITKELFESNSSNNENYKDWVKIGNYYLVGTEDKTKILANVAIAQAITSFSRIVMSTFKNNPNITIYYSDTDSIIVDKYLPDEFVSKSIIGLFKLEDEYLKFIALGPKVYGAINKYGHIYTKVKGFKDTVPLDKLELLLNENYQILSLDHKKWFKDINNSAINIRLNQYDLKINNNKRIAIFENNKFSKTESIAIESF